MMVYAGQSNRTGVAGMWGKSPHVSCTTPISASGEGSLGIYYNQAKPATRVARARHVSIRAELSRLAEVQHTQIPLGHVSKPPELGAVIEKNHMERVLGYIDLGVKEGAKIALGGRQRWWRPAGSISTNDPRRGATTCASRKRRSSAVSS